MLLKTMQTCSRADCFNRKALHQTSGYTEEKYPTKDFPGRPELSYFNHRHPASPHSLSHWRPKKNCSMTADLRQEHTTTSLHNSFIPWLPLLANTLVLPEFRRALATNEPSKTMQQSPEFATDRCDPEHCRSVLCNYVFCSLKQKAFLQK